MASSVGIVEALRQLELEFEKSHANLEYVIDKLETEFMRSQYQRSSQYAATGLVARSGGDVAAPNPCKLLRKLRHVHATLPRVRKELEDVMLQKQFLASFIITRMPPLQKRLQVLAQIAGVSSVLQVSSPDEQNVDHAGNEASHARCVKLSGQVQRGIKEYVDSSIQEGGCEIAMSHALYRSAFCLQEGSMLDAGTQHTERAVATTTKSHPGKAKEQRAAAVAQSHVWGKENAAAAHENNQQDRSFESKPKDAQNDHWHEKRASQSRQSIQSHQSLYSSESSVNASQGAKPGNSTRPASAHFEPISKQTFQRLPRNMKLLVPSLDELNKAFAYVWEFVGERTVTDDELSHYLQGRYDLKVLGVLSGAGVLRSCMCPGGHPGWKLK